MKRLRTLIRNALILLAAGVLLLAIVVVVNTLRLRSRQVQVSPIAPVALDRDGCVMRLGRTIEFKTIADADPQRIDPEPFLALHAYFEKAFPRTHAALKRETVGEGGLSLLYTWEGTDSSAPPCLLMSHIDVVPVETDEQTTWTYPPFAGRVAEDYVWGRGTLDVKCGAVGILEAVESLLADGFRPRGAVYIAMGHDEEVGGQHGNKEIAALLKRRGVRLRYVLDEGGAILQGVIQGPTSPVGFVGIAEKRCLSVRVVASGPEGHASSPPPQTAVGILAAAICKLESHPMPSRLAGATDRMLDFLGPEMPFPQKAVLANRWLFGGLIRRQFAAQPPTNATIRTTWAATMVDGGVAENVLPATATAYFNVRLLPGDTAKSVREHMERTIDDPQRVKVECSEAPSIEASATSDTDSPEFAALQRTIREVFPEVIVAPGLTIGATDSRHYEAIAENTFRFIPMRITPEDLNRIHGTDERISVDNYLELIRFYIRQISAHSGSGGEMGSGLGG